MLPYMFRMKRKSLFFKKIIALCSKIAFSVRSIYESYLGWFDGNATNLNPLTTPERARQIANLAGGIENMLQEAYDAFSRKEYQWAAELADMIMSLDPEGKRGREIKSEALFRLGEETYNTNARHYYFTQALELTGRIRFPQDIKTEKGVAHAIPIELVFKAMTISLDPVASIDKEMAVTFKITDTGEVYTVIVRRGVAEILRSEYEKADVVVHVEENLWKELATGVTSPVLALAGGKLKVDGLKIIALKEFMDLFAGP